MTPAEIRRPTKTGPRFLLEDVLETTGVVGTSPWVDVVELLEMIGEVELFLV